MWNRIVRHIQESRIFKRPSSPFLELKFQDPKVLVRSHIYYPFKIDLYSDYCSYGCDNIVKHTAFSPNAPFHFEFTPEQVATAVFQYRLPPFTIKNVDITDAKVATALSFRGTRDINLIATLSKAELCSLALSLNPMMISANYFRRNFGGEFIYSFIDDQPSFAAFFNHTGEKTSVTLMGSLYGNVSALVTNDVHQFRFSSLLEMNLFTFQSNSAISCAMPFGDSCVSVSYAFPTNTTTIELALNKFDNTNNRKTGITAYLPFKFSTVFEKFKIK